MYEMNVKNKNVINKSSTECSFEISNLNLLPFLLFFPILIEFNNHSNGHCAKCDCCVNHKDPKKFTLA